MRLIDADKLKEKMFTIEAWEYAPIDLHLIAVGDIDDAPTIDPVKHGKWIERGKDDNRCSLCGWGVWVNTNNYCPNCGAHMLDLTDRLNPNRREVQNNEEPAGT